MTKQHTPGPWTVTPHPYLPIASIHHGPPDPRWALKAPYNIAAGWYGPERAAHWAVSTTARSTRESLAIGAVSMRENTTSDANARLIAAAPDLLAALKAASGSIDDCGMSLEAYGNLIDQIDAAITKAEEG